MGDNAVGQLLSQSEYAKRRGVSRQFISKVVSAGTLPGHGDRNQIDPAEADAILDGIARSSREDFRKANNPRAGLPGPAEPGGDTCADGGQGPGGPGDGAALDPSHPNWDKGKNFLRFKAAETREKEAKAAIAELELEQKRGELGLVAEFENAAFEKGKQYADALDTLVKFGPEIVGSIIKILPAAVLKAVLVHKDEMVHEARQILKREGRRIKQDLMLPEVSAEPEAKKAPARKKAVKKKAAKKQPSKKKPAVKKKTKKKAVKKKGKS